MLARISRKRRPLEVLMRVVLLLGLLALSLAPRRASALVILTNPTPKVTQPVSRGVVIVPVGKISR